MIELKGLEQVQRDLNRYGAEKIKDLADAGKKSALAVEREAKKNVRVDENRLRSSIRYRASDDNPIVFEIFTDIFYAPYEEFGTGKHVNVPPELESVAIEFKGKGRGKFQDLLNNISEWANRNGISEDAVYPIAAKIAREGREGKAFLFPAWDGERRNYLKEVTKVLQ